MTTDAALLRRVNVHGVTYVALHDVAALLLDTAESLDAVPEITAGTALRSVASGFAEYEEPRA